MGLHFKGNLVAAVEIDNPGVVDEGRAHPTGARLLSRGADVGIQQAVDLFVFAGDGDLALEGFMAAMLAPGLGDHLEFDVGRVAVQLNIVIPDRAHFPGVERGQARGVEPGEAPIVELADREALHLPGGFGRAGEDRFDRPDREALNYIVGQQPLGQGRALFGGKRAADDVARAGGGALDALDIEHVGAADDLLGHRVGHARAQRNLDHERAGRGLGGLIAPGAGLDDRVGEQFSAQLLALGGGQFSFQEVKQLALDLADGFEPECVGIGKE
jgi:hypothetical protein